jgi:hypothetical protein
MAAQPDRSSLATQVGSVSSTIHFKNTASAARRPNKFNLLLDFMARSACSATTQLDLSNSSVTNSIRISQSARHPLQTGDAKSRASGIIMCPSGDT